VVNAVGTSPFWNDSVVIVLWDDWGGWYDHATPQYLDSHGLGFRVPLMVISPFAKPGYVSHVHYEFGSVLKFVETTFGLTALAASDARANPLDDCFQFSAPPRPFSAIRTKRTPTSFLRETPSGTAPDTQ
jgi:phospholipase C